MRQQPANHGIKHANKLAAARNLDPKQPLDGEAEGMLLIHRRAIVEPVEIWHVLQIGARLHQLLGAAMQKPDMGIDASHHLAVQFKHESEHTVSSRMHWSEIYGEVAFRCETHDETPVRSAGTTP